MVVALPRTAADPAVLLRELGASVAALSRRLAEAEARQAANAARITKLQRKLCALRGRVALPVAKVHPPASALLAALPGDVAAIVAREAGACGVTPLEVMSRSKFGQVSKARRRAMLAAVALPLSLRRVGELFGRDHATVRSACAVERKQGGAG